MPFVTIVRSCIPLIGARHCAVFARAARTAAQCVATRGLASHRRLLQRTALHLQHNRALSWVNPALLRLITYRHLFRRELRLAHAAANPPAIARRCAGDAAVCRERASAAPSEVPTAWAGVCEPRETAHYSPRCELRHRNARSST